MGFLELIILNFMTFNFDTYPANVSNTPTIATFTDQDELFFTQNLTSCAFLGKKFETGDLVKVDSNGKYHTQVYYVHDDGTNGTWKALVGFTWDSSSMYFGVFEFKSGESSKEIEGIKVYKVTSNSVTEIKQDIAYQNDNPQETSIKYLRVGVFTEKDHTPLFGYSFVQETSTTTQYFYLPPRSFFLDGKHAPVTSPSFDGQLAVVASKILSFNGKA